MFPVILLPGFGATNLSNVQTNQLIWFDMTISSFIGLNQMRLSPDGFTPLLPDGRLLGPAAAKQEPWAEIVDQLQFQLDSKVWQIGTLGWDFRLDLVRVAATLADQIRTTVRLSEPATLVGHSAGGLLAVLTYQDLVGTGDAAKVRRVISIGTPFQGCYLPTQWLSGVNPSVLQLLSVSQAFGSVVGFNPAFWTLANLNSIACTWPSFYQLMPFISPASEITDPNRDLLFTATNYPAIAVPSQAWLDYARFTFQPLVQGLTASPPSWVMTSVGARGIITPNVLRESTIPLHLDNIGTTSDGDGVVTVQSALKFPGEQWVMTGAHASLPLGLARNGQLAQMIVDPRGPISPPPGMVFSKLAIDMNVIDVPISDLVSGLTCLSGG